MAKKLKKRLIFCFDGTWNNLSADVNTNVAKIAQMIRPICHDGTPQIVHYDEGIGTNTNWVRQKYQGAFGLGMEDIIREAYRFLIFNYEPGDEIFAFGFSRGAFTARSFLGFIRHAGILDVVSANEIEKAIEIYKSAPAGVTGEESGMAMRFRSRHCKAVCVSEADRQFRARLDPTLDPSTLPLINLRYLGVWDTVRALGIPAFLPGAGWFNRKYSFHDAVLTSKIVAARHAVALDELRPTFRATLFGRAKVKELNGKAESAAERALNDWELPYLEHWFPGVHGAVGGGGARRGLSDGSLAWVLAGAKRAGLQLRDDGDAKTFLIQPDPLDNLQNNAAKTAGDRIFGKIRRMFHSPRSGPTEAKEIALATYQRWWAPDGASKDGGLYRPGALAGISAILNAWPYGGLTEYKSEHVVQRGQTLSAIAKERLGAAQHYPEIFEANRDRLEDPDHILPGTVLRIPALPDDDLPNAGPDSV